MSNVDMTIPRASSGDGENPVFHADTLLTDPDTHIIITCGAGGVGKTTTAAALAVRAASQGRTVAVLTIDPARRLAQSLGLTELDNTPRRIATDLPGELWAMMLDTRRTFDDMVAAHSSPQRAEQIFANPFYQTISSSFSGTQEYMAMEKLGQLAQSGRFDLILVDTPPSRSALDFLDAPQRLSSFLDGRMIRLLTTPGRGMLKIVGVGVNLMTKAVSSVIGGQLLTDAAQFVQLFEDMFGGFRQRAETTYALLRDAGSSFLVVATFDPDAIREASYFADRLRSDTMPLAGLIINRTHPQRLDIPLAMTEEALEELDQMTSKAKPILLARAALAIHHDRLVTRAQERRARARFDRAHPDVPITELPIQPTDVHDLPGLHAVGDALA